MKKTYVFLLVMFVALLVNPLSAELLLTDDFTGTVGTLLTENGWTAHSGAGTTPMSIASPGLTYTGYPGSGIGNRTSASGNGEDVNKTISTITAGSVYYSLMLNAATTTTTSGHISHFMQSSSLFYGRLWIVANGGGINLGLSKSSNTPTFVGGATPTVYPLNTTHLIVIKYTFNTGSSTDDVVSLWVNPVLSGSEPTPDLTFAESSTDASSILGFALRQYNAGQLAQFDGIRVGTSWDDIVGSSTITAPTVQASAITFSNVGQVSMTANWTNGDGARRVVIMNTTNSFTNPVNGTDPTADPVYAGSGQQVVYNGTGSSVSVTGLSPSTTYWFRAYEYNGTGTETMFLTTTATGNPNSQQTAAPAPLLLVSPASLSGFTYVSGNGPSANQTFTVSGLNLTNNISIAAPADYEISLNGTTFSSPLTLIPSGGTVAETMVYVRLIAGLAIASYNGEVIDITSTGATPLTVTCNGSVTAPLPSASVTLRPAYIDISATTSESAVLMTLSNYPTDDVRYRLYNDANQYYCWNVATGTYVTSTAYASGPQALGTATTSTTFWIMSQRGSNATTVASYRDRLGPTYPTNYQTTALPAATEITTPFTLSGIYYGSTEYPLTNKYVVLAYSGTTLISAASTALTTGELAVVCPVGTTIDLIEIRDQMNNLVDDKTGTWTETTNVGGFGTAVGYYDTVIGLEGAALKAGLHEVIKNSHTTQFSYTATTEELKYVDEDPLNSSNIVQIYTGWSIPKTAYGIGDTDWNKEHVWSKSHGDFGDNAPAGTDLHHLRPCDSTVNTAKSNRDFDFGVTPYVDASPYPGYSGDTGCSTSAYVWEPRDADKGDVARMIFYMATRYEGTDTTYDLEVVDYVNTAPAYEPFYGKLSTLLAWHHADPPDAWELRRNDRIQERQGNRNPYIDHPEWVASIWGDTEPADHVTNFAVGTVTTSSIQLTWTDAVAEGYLIKASPVSYAAIATPVDGVTVTEGLFAYVAQGVQTYTFTGLDSNMQYFFKIFPHNLSGNYIDYKTDGTVPQVTGATEGESPYLLEENFVYTVGQTLTSTTYWAAHSGAGTQPAIVAEDNLFYPGYEPNSGYCATTVFSGSAEDVHRTFPTQTSGSVYAAVLFKLASLPNTTGDYVFHFGPNPIGTDFKGRVFVQRDASNQIRFGVSKGTTTVAYTDYSYALDTTYLIVLKYTIVEGATNDQVYMWVNPLASSTEPAPMLTATDVATTDINNVGAIAIRQGTNTPITKIDGIRVATNWAALFPATGPAIYVTQDLVPFGTLVGEPSAIQSYSVVGSSLTENISVTAPAGFQLSLDGITNWTSPITITQTGGYASATVFVRFNPAMPGTYSGNIVHSTAGVDPVNVPVTGTGYNALFEVTGNILPFTGIVGTPSAYQTYHLTAVNISNFFEVTVTGPFQILDTMHPSPTWTDYLYLEPEYTGDIQVRFVPTAAGTFTGAITHSIDGDEAAPVVIELSGEATSPAPTMSVLPTAMTFSANSGASSDAQMATITSANLITPITISSTGEYTFSATSDGTFTNPYSITSNYNGTIQFWIKFNPTSIGTFNNVINLVSGTASAQINATGYGLDPNAIFATDLFFSEYIEGSSNNKALEIYNGTGHPVDLSDYRVYLYSNGASTPGNTLNMTGTLAHNDVYVIANASANAAILALADITSTVTFYNGDDAVALYKVSTDSYVDIFGRIGDDPGTAWTGDGGYSTLDKTLVRKSFITQGVTVNPTGTGPTAFTTLTTEWDLYPIDTISDLGEHTFLPGLTPADAPVFSVPAGVVTAPFMLALSTTTPGGQIRYTTDGSDPTETSTLYGAPFQISVTTAVKARTYAAGYSPSAIAIASYIFPTQVANLAALRAMTPGTGTYYLVTGEAVLTFQQATRHQKYLQDATAAILIDDAPGTITTNYNLYDGITGICGTLTTYSGLLQFVPATDPGPATSTNNVVIPEVRTFASLTSADQAKLIKVLGVNLDFSSGNFLFTAQNINATDPTATLVMRTFPSTDYSGTPIPDYTVDLICLVGEFSGTMQISPRFLSDFSPAGGTLEAPANLVISAVGNDIVITWDNDMAATSWTVWSADDAYGTFNLRSTVFTNSCTLSGEAGMYGKRFYYVIANN